MKNAVLAILAGGFSRRYQNGDNNWRDKALMEINGRPLLVKLIEDGLKTYKDICVSVNSEERKSQYSRILMKFEMHEKAKIIVDSPNLKFHGALKGITTILQSCYHDPIQFVPCDRPYLDLSVLSKMTCPELGISFLTYENGMIEPLLALYGAKIIVQPEFTKLSLTRADVYLRLAPILQIYNVSEIIKQNNLTPLFFINVNLSTDMKSNKKKEKRDFVIPEPYVIKKDFVELYETPKDKKEILEYLEFLTINGHYYAAFLWTLSAYESNLFSKEDFYIQGIKSLKQEFKFWNENNVPFLALHAIQDLVKTFPKENNSETKRTIVKFKQQLGIKTKKI
ncbi:MAG: NTP transferase domain-containing protein [Candidatus Heimdallarchaeaceae archaeon]